MTTAAAYLPISGNFYEDRDSNLVVPGPNAFFKISNSAAAPAADDYAVRSGNDSPRLGNMRWLFLFLTGDRSVVDNDLFKVFVRSPIPFTQAEVDASPVSFAPTVILTPSSPSFYTNSVFSGPPTVASLFDVATQMVKVDIVTSGFDNTNVSMLVDVDFSHSAIS